MASRLEFREAGFLSTGRYGEVTKLAVRPAAPSYCVGNRFAPTDPRRPDGVWAAGDSAPRAAAVGAAASSWLFFACFETFSRGVLVFLFGGASVPLSPLGVAAA